MAWNWGNSLRGSATGAAAGTSVMPGWGTAIGSVVGGLGGLFGGEDEDKTDKLLAGIPDELKKYIMPYITAGQGALGRVSGEYENLLNDPNAIIKRIGSGYKESPGYQWRLNQGKNAINNAAARGGMVGTAQHQQNAGELAENLANQDYNDYMKNALGLYGTGLSGEQGLVTGGQGAASDLGTSLANLLQGRAGINFQRGQANNKMNSDLMSSILAILTKNQNNSV